MWPHLSQYGPNKGYHRIQSYKSILLIWKILEKINKILFFSWTVLQWSFSWNILHISVLLAQHWFKTTKTSFSLPCYVKGQLSSLRPLTMYEGQTDNLCTSYLTPDISHLKIWNQHPWTGLRRHSSSGWPNKQTLGFWLPVIKDG